MKILEIIPSLNSGGAEKFVVDLTNELSRQNHKCILLTLFGLSSKDIFRTLLSRNVKQDFLNKHLGFDVKCLFNLYKYVYKEKPNVVHAHIGSISYLILPALFYRRCKYFATIHSDAEFEAGKGLHKILRKFLFKCKLVTPITISEESERSFERFYAMSGILIPNGCSEYTFSEPINKDKYRQNIDFLFVHAGRLNNVKNQICLVRAFDKLLKDGVKARLILLGRKEDEAIYNQISPYFSNNIIYLGEHKDARAFINISDAFCLTSSWEGMPITIIEAFSVACPAIVTPVGGCINMVEDGVNGFLADDASEDSYYRSLKRFISLSEDERKQMKVNALAAYKNKYSIERTCKDYLKLFSNHL